MLKDFITNASVLIASFFIIGHYYKNKPVRITSPLAMRINLGIVFGLLGIVLMLFSIRLTPTVIVDLRHITVIIAALYGGMAAALVSAAMIAAGRIALFGFHPASVTAAIFMLAIGIGCGFLSRARILYWKKSQIMNVFCLLLLSLCLYLNIGQKSLLLSVYLYHWSISISVVFLLFLLPGIFRWPIPFFEKYRKVKTATAPSSTIVKTSFFKQMPKGFGRSLIRHGRKLPGFP
ncbi:LytS/YhcK type 5TM receptor domain-containing protein [Aneurinibacillus terranovensis]|uniref:LytS/YhcK type 5TM receptor domain-containing protein n=1 Tax=Aneurinibacillus terranovensis TaxID=278991 RepID=UPI0004042D22|nr:LytS/YhcK type 5TM receptor domain-containing protein [Aneurinibacillus terranovensis]